MMAWLLNHNGLLCGIVVMILYFTKQNLGMEVQEDLDSQTGIQNHMSGGLVNTKSRFSRAIFGKYQDFFSLKAKHLRQSLL
jgi:hypothetical protein